MFLDCLSLLSPCPLKLGFQCETWSLCETPGLQYSIPRTIHSVFRSLSPLYICSMYCTAVHCIQSLKKKNAFMKCSPVLCTNVLQVQCTYVLLYSNQPIQTCKYLPVGQALTKHHIRRIKAAILYQDDFEEQDEFISFFKSSWYVQFILFFNQS